MHASTSVHTATIKTKLSTVAPTHSKQHIVSNSKSIQEYTLPYALPYACFYIHEFIVMYLYAYILTCPLMTGGPSGTSGHRNLASAQRGDRSRLVNTLLSRVSDSMVTLYLR